MPRRKRAKPARRKVPAPRALDASAVAPATPESKSAAGSAVASGDESRAATPGCVAEAQAPPACPTGPPRLTKAGYYTQPCAEQLAALPDTALAALVGFAVGRTGYGLIEWEGAVDVRGLDLDAVVIIRHAGVDVYPRGCGLSPPVGTGLNRPAAVTLAERGVLASAVAEQPAAAERGAVELRLQRRDADGARRVWTYAVPLAGGEAALLSTEGTSDKDDDDDVPYIVSDAGTDTEHEGPSAYCSEDDSDDELERVPTHTSGRDAETEEAKLLVVKAAALARQRERDARVAELAANCMGGVEAAGSAIDVQRLSALLGGREQAEYAAANAALDARLPGPATPEATGPPPAALQLATLRHQLDDVDD